MGEASEKWAMLSAGHTKLSVYATHLFVTFREDSFTGHLKLSNIDFFCKL